MDLDVEQQTDRLLLEPVEHADEHVVTLALVLHQRVALRHGAQADALLEVVHLIEVLTPLAVEHGQQHVALQLPHGIRSGNGRDLRFPYRVGLFGIRDEQIPKLLATQLAGLADGLGVDQIMVVDAHRIQRPQGGPQRVEVPVLGIALRGGTIDVGGDDIDKHVVRLLL